MRLAGASSNEMKVWNSGTGQELHTVEGHTDKTNSVAFSPDGHSLACGVPEATVKIYDATPLLEKP